MKSIKEIYGLGDKNYQPNQIPNTNIWKSGLNDNFEYNIDPIKPLEKFPMDNDQKNILKNIIDNQDTIVSLPPSRGKTRPVINAVLQFFQKKLLNNYNLSVLFVVPRKQLAGQIGQNDFIKNIKDFILTVDDPRIDERQIQGFSKNTFFAHIRNIQDNKQRDKEAEIYAINLVDEISGDGGSLTKNSIIAVATYEKAQQIINQKYFSHIIVDELQELIPHPNESINDGLEKRFISLITVLRQASSSSCIVLMTGSVNYQSVNHLKNYFNTKFKRNFKILPEYAANSPPLLNRSKLVLLPLQTISGYPSKSIPERVNLCKNIIISDQNNSILIIFSKQRTGQGIFKLIEDIINILPPKPTAYFTKNITPATEQRVKDVILNNAKTMLNENNDIEFLKYFNLTETILSNESKPTNISKDETNILYQGVLRGVAPLVGSMLPIHKKICQNLFKQKKIQLLLATDALGVGANVDCKHIYIPTVHKFNGSRMERTDESSLTQLVHRAGRNVFDIAYVYCAVEDYDYISNLIFNDPRSAIPQINTNELNKLEQLEKILPPKSFLNILRGLLR